MVFKSHLTTRVQGLTVITVARKQTRTILQWITWPFKSLTNVLAMLFNFLVDLALKFFHRVVWPLRFLKNQYVAFNEFLTSLCSFLNQKIQEKFEDPIKVIEAVLEVIWMVVSPYVRAVTWLCEIIIIVKRYIEVRKYMVSSENKRKGLQSVQIFQLIRTNTLVDPDEHFIWPVLVERWITQSAR